jgi:hypothetical protein
LKSIAAISSVVDNHHSGPRIRVGNGAAEFSVPAALEKPVSRQNLAHSAMQRHHGQVHSQKMAEDLPDVIELRIPVQWVASPVNMITDTERVNMIRIFRASGSYRHNTLVFRGRILESARLRAALEDNQRCVEIPSDDFRAQEMTLHGRNVTSWSEQKMNRQHGDHISGIKSLWTFLTRQ